MQTPTQALNIGADVAKDEIVVACSEGSLRTRKLANQRTALLAFLKGLDGFAADLKALRQRFDQVIARIDQRVKALVEASPDRKQHVTHLRTINGVGPVARSSALHWLTPLSMCP